MSVDLRPERAPERRKPTPASVRKMPTSALQEIAWREGSLEHVMMPTQREASGWWDSNGQLRSVVLCNRRWGKSFWLLLVAISTCMKKPGAAVHYAAPTAKQVRGIIEPHMEHILSLCPEGLRPEYHRQDGIYVFPKMPDARRPSRIVVAGVDNRGADRLRGAETDLAIVDEARDVDDLTCLVRDVLMPQTLTTGGRILIGSTPPRTAAHEFRQHIVAAQADGALFKRNVHDCTHISPEKVQLYIKESGGEHTSSWRREYLAEMVIDETLAIVPEFDKAKHVAERQIPKHFRSYVAMDVGYSDLTVAGLGIHDFEHDVIYLVAECVFRNEASAVIERGVEKMERQFLGSKEPDGRYVDAPPLVVADLRNTAGRSWSQAKKDDADGALNKLRLAVQRGRLIIHPRCTTTIAHLEGGVWNSSRTSFDRSDPQYGHFDAIDMLKYLVRHVDPGDNPNPAQVPTFDQVLLSTFRRKAEDEIPPSALFTPLWRQRQ